ncbi:MAG: MaoC family dehydratase N-terminal domain-containing protein, partial [Dehalococcoidia bacterium]|nr:MaoC family dehydratase N-terminal domain-containing protein [Dehalococcoidia bacterium]
ATLAPPGFFGWPVKQPTPQYSQIHKELMEALGEAGFPDILDGGSDYEFMLPVCAGDTLVLNRRFTDLMSRAGARKMAFMTVENSYTNQNGQLVAKVRQTIIALSKVA